MLSPIEQNLVNTLGKLLSLDEMELLIDILDNSADDFYEGVCEEFIRLYPEDARDIFGDHQGRNPQAAPRRKEERESRGH